MATRDGDLEGKVFASQQARRIITNLMTAKIVVLGAQGVGKTAFLNRYISNSFDVEQQPTIGANFLVKRLLSTDTNPPISLKLQIWDTAGQERFRSISKLYYRGANAALLCYDITSEATFLDMNSWMEELRKNLGQECLIHVIGTKADVVAEDANKREVPFERCIQYVSEHLKQCQLAASGRSMSFSTNSPQTPGADPRSSGVWGSDLGWDSCHEISAKDGDGVDEVFRILTRKLVEQRSQRERELERQRTSSVALAGNEGSDSVRRSANTGSFRLGLGDKRRSWMIFPPSSGDTQAHSAPARKGRCC